MAREEIEQGGRDGQAEEREELEALGQRSLGEPHPSLHASGEDSSRGSPDAQVAVVARRPGRRRLPFAAQMVARWLAPAALFLVAVAIRALPWRTVFVGDEILFFDPDSYYHLRRIVWSVVHFPAVLDFDRYVAFPEGGRPIWTPCFDWLVALLALPFARPGSLASIERVAVWVPPLLGGATVVALYRVAQRHFDAAAALLAGALLAVLSGHFWYSRLGFVDHHAAEALASTLLLAATMGLLDREARGEGLARPAIATGLALAAALLVWPGSLLYVAIAEAGLLVALLTRPDARRSAAFARAFAGAQAVALAAVLPFAAAAGPTRFGPWSPLVLSRFQPWWFAMLGAGGAACAALWWRRPALAARPARRAACASLVSLVLLALSAAPLPALARGAADAWAWLGKREGFQGLVAESQPLLVLGGGFGLEVAASRLSWLALLSPLALAAAAAWAWRRPGRAALGLWIGWSAVLLAVTLLQRRFFNTFSVCFALLLAWAARSADARLAAAFGPRPSRRRVARAALAAGILACLAPVAASYRPYLVALLQPAELASVHAVPLHVRWRATLEMARWFDRQTPPTAGWLDPARQPEYGVLGPWGVGHMLQYAGRRPTVVDNFGDDVAERGFELARRYYASPELDASRILDELGVRYVIAQRDPAFPGPAPDEHSMFTSLYYLDGSEFEPGPEARGRPAVPALARHRLVYESALRLAAAPDLPPFFKVFEHVPGARVEGRARPGARVEARVELRTNRGRELVFRTHAWADGEGRYALRLPYANRGAPPSVRVGPAYALACDGEHAQLVLREREVRRGATLAGPALCLRPRAAPASGAAALSDAAPATAAAALR
jgi:dolichyl-diphosphooligosaccharide--protein glycosyltransferase